MAKNILDEVDKFTEEEQKAIDRADELAEKKDKTEAEKAELVTLKKERTTAYQKRIDMLKSVVKEKEYLHGKATEETESLKARIVELEKQPKQPPVKPIGEELVTIAGKQWYTDDALLKLVQNGELTDAEAFKHQKERDKEDSTDRVLKRIKEENAKDAEQKVRKEDVDEVLKDYPHFNKNHKDFDENDPLYQEATRLWEEGYKYNPKGLTKAIKDAKRILGITEKRPDASELHTVNNSNAPAGSNAQRASKVTLTADENNTAIRVFTRGNFINPKTNKPYTEAEAVQKALAAKERKIAAKAVER